MSAWDGMLAKAGLELAHFSGVARLFERRAAGTIAILKFEHCRPPQDGAFAPLRQFDVTPEFLDRAITALKRWKFDIVSMDEVVERLNKETSSTRAVCLTFDGGHRDFISFAYPVLSRHRVPFMVYVPAGFIDGLAKPWQPALVGVIARNSRIGLVMKGADKRFIAESAGEKYELYDALRGWLMTLPPDDLTAAIRDLCSRYGVDFDTPARGQFMTWQDLTALARDPYATIGSATVHYPNLARARGTAALREMTMGRAVIETALDLPFRHFAYPYGDAGTFQPRDRLLAREAGFASAVSTVPGLIHPGLPVDLMALPRIAWDGRHRSLRALRVVLSGMTIRAAKSAAPEPAAS